MRIFSDLKLDGPAAPRARPGISRWGGADIPSTRKKRWQRVLAPILFVLMAIVITALGYFFYKALGG